MRLHDHPENPAPPGGEAMILPTADGLTLRAAFWPARGQARGTIVVANGRAEFIEKYFETIGELLARGFAVVSFDWRGQGGSARLTKNRRKGHVRRFADYEEDVAALVRHVLEPHAPKPWFGLGHSMGGAIFLRMAHAGRLPLERVVLSAPMVEIHGLRWPDAARGLARTLALLGLRKAYIPFGKGRSGMAEPFENNVLTGDARRHARNAALARSFDDLSIGDPTIGWVDAAFDAMEPFGDVEFARRTVLPILILAAGHDRVVSTAAAEWLGARLKAGRTLVIPHAEHELLMERDAIREQVWAAFDAFIPGEAAEAAKDAAA